MEFNKAIHTKEFLMANVDVAFDLAKKSSDFAQSELANDAEILSFKNIDGWTIAHRLAQHQPQWLHSKAAKSNDILSLKNNSGCTVAYLLAYNQPQWLHSEEAKNPDILRLKDNKGWPVALILIIKYEEFRNNEALFHKSILSLCRDGKLLAETISGNYDEIHGLDVTVMAMKMISQGAAYIHSKPMPVEVGESLLKQAKTIVDDSMESLVTLKKLQALYSTFYHQVEKIKATKELKSLDKWLSILGRVEGMLADHLNANPELFDIDHNIDIFCEPGDELLKRLASEHVLKNNLSLADGYDVPVQDLQSNTGLY